MSNEHVVPPPKQLYASPNGDSPAGWSYSDTPLDDEFVAYACIPEGIDPDDAGKAMRLFPDLLRESVETDSEIRELCRPYTDVEGDSYGVPGLAGVVEASLAAAEQKCAALVEAIKADLREWWSFNERQQHTHSWHTKHDFFNELDKAMAGRCSLLTHVPAAIAQQDQPEAR